MARWEVHRTDGNAAELYAAAKKLGFSVEKLDRPVDALFGIYDQTVAVEVKLPKAKKRPDQKRFFRTFKGMKRTIRTVGDVLDLFRELRERHEILFPPKSTAVSQPSTRSAAHG